MLFYQTGELFQSIAVGKARKSIASLMEWEGVALTPLLSKILAYSSAERARGLEGVIVYTLDAISEMLSEIF